MKKIGTGLRFFNCNAQQILQCNKFDGCYRGVELNGSWIGDQGDNNSPNDNEWLNQPTGFKDAIGINGLSNFTSSNWFFRVSTANLPNDQDPIVGTGAEPILINTCTGSVPPFLCNPPLISADEDAMRLMNVATNLAAQLISAANPDNQPEINEQQLYEIYLATWAQGIYEFTSEQYSLLYNIAIQNPMTGGNAVFGARVMLGIDVDDITDYGSNRFLNQNNHNFSFTPYHKVKLFPNPALNETIYSIRLKDTEVGEIIISDILGNVVLKIELTAGWNETLIETNKFQHGVYLISTYINGKLKEKDKLVVIK